MSNLNRATVSALKGETIARGDDRKAITGDGPLVKRYNTTQHGLVVGKVYGPFQADDPRNEFLR